MEPTLQKVMKLLEKVIKTIRKERRPFLVHAKVPLLNHHTSGVRMEWYRDDLEEARSRDPYPVLKQQLLDSWFSEKEVNDIENSAKAKVKSDFEKALKAEDPKPEDLFTQRFCTNTNNRRKGNT